ncbi:hypothetical protein ACFYXH_25030 [Streptomyces sp. NPDC002730]|uniref:hypothetical protein n=1 Tax=Streptomyces sp. NPDC002730 TaxID=3364662 RepID=UPI00369A4C68
MSPYRSAAIHERANELALLCAVVRARNQLCAMVRSEPVLVPAFGTAVGLALGGLLDRVLVKASEGAGDTANAFVLRAVATE